MQTSVAKINDWYTTYLIHKKHFSSTNRVDREEFAQLEKKFKSMRAILVETADELVFQEYAAVHARLLQLCAQNLRAVLEAILEKLAAVEPHTVAQIRAELALFSFDDESKRTILLKGELQSGKTAAIVVLALCYSVCSNTVSVVLRNRTADKRQFEERLKQISRKVGIKRTRGINVVIYSEANCKKLLVATDGNRNVLIADEADMRAVEGSFLKLKKKSRISIMVSATVQDILVEPWDIQGSSVFTLAPPSSYRGLDRIDYEIDENLRSMEGLFYRLCDIAIATNPVALVVSENRLVNLGELARRLRENSFEIDGAVYSLPDQARERTVILFTGEGIDFYSTDADAWKTIDAKPKEMDGFYRFENTELCVVMRGCRLRGDSATFIVSANLASRGINFTTRDERNLHLTHMILDKPDSSTCANITQCVWEEYAGPLATTFARACTCRLKTTLKSTSRRRWWRR
jgi:hypothetical protein